MTYNILDDEKHWQNTYKTYLNNLSNDDLIKELVYLSNFNLNDIEELLELKTRLTLITEVIKTKLDLMDDKLKDVHILTNKEYSELVIDAINYSEHYNISE